MQIPMRRGALSMRAGGRSRLRSPIDDTLERICSTHPENPINQILLTGQA
jgi:hypothetical protein